MCELVLVRHGEQQLGKHLTTGETLDPPLSELGLQQIEAVGQRLAGVHVDAVYSSPLRRALDTGRAIARHHGLEPTTVPALVEFEPWQQLPSDRPLSELLPHEEISQIFRSHTRQRRWDDFPYSEDVESFRTRVVTAIDEIVTHHPGQRVVITSHSGIVNTYLSQIWQTPFDFLVRLHHTSLTVVRGADVRRAVISVNDFAHVLPFQVSVNPSNV